MMLLYDGAHVTVGMMTFAEPFSTAREAAAEILTIGGRTVGQTPARSAKPRTNAA